MKTFMFDLFHATLTRNHGFVITILGVTTFPNFTKTRALFHIAKYPKTWEYTVSKAPKGKIRELSILFMNFTLK